VDNDQRVNDPADAWGHGHGAPDVGSAILNALARRIESAPPTIGVVGGAGVGKSSTINAMFKTTLAVSHTATLPRRFEHIDLTVRFDPTAEDVPAGMGSFTPKVRLRVIDAPGLGGDIGGDEAHLAQYRRHLPGCDAILWVMAARNRAIALDQRYLLQLRDFRDRMVFGINQVDLVEPVDWRAESNLPSRRQQRNITAIQQDRARRLAGFVGRDPTVVCYSSRRGYRLEHVFDALLTVCPPDRQWIFAGIKNFNYLDFIPPTPRAGVARRTTRSLARLFGSKKQ
jgi:predicted GTPase